MLSKIYANRYYTMASEKRTTSVPPVKSTFSAPIGKVGESLELTCPSAHAVPSAIKWYLGNDTKGIQRSATDCSPSGSPSFYNMGHYNFTCDNVHKIYRMTILQLQSSDRDQCWSCSYAYNNDTASKISSPFCIMLESLPKLLVSTSSPHIGKVGMPLKLTCRLMSVGDRIREITWHYRDRVIKLFAETCAPLGSSSLLNQDLYKFACDNHYNIYSMEIPRLLSPDNGQRLCCSVLGITQSYNISPACITIEHSMNEVLVRPVSLSFSMMNNVQLLLNCQLEQDVQVANVSDITWYLGNDTKGIKLSAVDCSPSGSPLLYDQNRYIFTCDNNNHKYGMTIPRLLDSDNGTCWSCGVAYSDAPASNISAPACIMMTARDTVSLSISPKTANVGLPFELTCRLHSSSGAKPSDIVWYLGNDTKGFNLSAADCSLSVSSSVHDLVRYSFSCDNNNNIYGMTIPRLLDSDNGTCWSCGVAFRDLLASNISTPACITMPVIPIVTCLDNMMCLLLVVSVCVLIVGFIIIWCKEILMGNSQSSSVTNSSDEIELTEQEHIPLRHHSRTINQEPDEEQHTVEETKL